MRHGNHKYKLGVKPAHRQAIIKNLAIEVFEHGTINTTHARCMALRGYVEKLITLAKVDSVHNRRLAYSKLNNDAAVVNLFKLAPKFANRNGGYTRVVKIAEGRVGDNAKVSYFSLVD